MTHKKQELWLVKGRKELNNLYLLVCLRCGAGIYIMNILAKACPETMN
jgi:hypothetical protein